MTVAVITGGSRGIGAATAPLLAAQGHDVVLSYVDRPDAAATVVASCEAQGVRALAVRADMREPPAIAALFAAADDIGPLGVLVANAGVVAPQARVEEITAERMAELFAVNVTGAFLCCGEAVRRMSTARGGAGGVIVPVSSAAARLGGSGRYVDYAASKGAIDTQTNGLALEVAGEGIRVAGVRPGIIDTEIHASGGAPGRAHTAGAQTPLGRPGTAQEVAGAIAWLCSDAASYVTGTILDVAGGR